MNLFQKIFGWLYLIVHVFLIPLSLPKLVVFLQDEGYFLSNADLNFFYYALGFIVLGTVMSSYLRRTFDSLCDRFFSSVKAVFVSLVIYYGCTYVLGFVLSFFLTDLVNPNTESVFNTFEESGKTMFIVSVILAPIVEEILFRGVVFGTIRRKSKIAAYIISVAMFSVYHLWQYFLREFEPIQLLYILQYVPGSVLLAKIYEDSGNLWAPISAHMIINYVAVLASKVM